MPASGLLVGSLRCTQHINKPRRSRSSLSSFLSLHPSLPLSSYMFVSISPLHPAPSPPLMLLWKKLLCGSFSVRHNGALCPTWWSRIQSSPPASQALHYRRGWHWRLIVEDRKSKLCRFKQAAGKWEGMCSFQNESSHEVNPRKHSSPVMSGHAHIMLT